MMSLHSFKQELAPCVRYNPDRISRRRQERILLDNDPALTCRCCAGGMSYDRSIRLGVCQECRWTCQGNMT